MSRPPRLCSCGKIVASGVRCACQITNDRARKARHDQRRPSARARGYTAQWQEARAAFLLAHPYCQHNGCGKPATVVHHTVRHRGDLRIFWDRSKWMAVCQPCHDGPLQSHERKP